MGKDREIVWVEIRKRNDRRGREGGGEQCRMK